MLDRDKPERAQALLAQTMKAMEQVAISNGSWKAAWPLTGVRDPYSRRAFAGDERETEIVAAYITELEALETKVRARGGARASSGNDSEDEHPPQAAGEGKKKKNKKKAGAGGEVGAAKK